MNSYDVRTVSGNSCFSSDVTLDSFLLLPAKLPFTDRLKAFLYNWEVKAVFSAGVPLSTTAQPAVPASVLDQEELKTKSGAEQIKICQSVYDNYCAYLSGLFTVTREYHPLDSKAIVKAAEKLCDFIIQNRRLFLHVKMLYDGSGTLEETHKMLVYHCMHSAVLAVLVGLEFALTRQHLVDLTVAAMVHEAGMFYLSNDTYKGEKKLPVEHRESIKHVSMSAKILASAQFSPPIVTAVLEHQERENGSGYPKQLTGEYISSFGKILGVICSYEALCTPRPSRLSISPHRAMVEILTGANRLYDPKVANVLLRVLSLYPIGTYVLLSDGRCGQVVEVNPRDPRNPIVSPVEPAGIFGAGPDRQKSAAKLIVPHETTVKIVRELSKEEFRRESKNFAKNL
ncbi:MAG: HD domain-containing protein [Spirochaetaceae bacterium]|jgi:HD-GYP domain-containing protein (c-di-GMP phosphodiesterase class II)|nr:HD domain-containing protein [Spirochaetaceae bacterium]